MGIYGEWALGIALVVGLVAIFAGALIAARRAPTRPFRRYLHRD